MSQRLTRYLSIQTRKMLHGSGWFGCIASGTVIFSVKMRRTWEAASSRVREAHVKVPWGTKIGLRAEDVLKFGVF
jgi:hypothetical protein